MEIRPSYVEPKVDKKGIKMSLLNEKTNAEEFWKKLRMGSPNQPGQASKRSVWSRVSRQSGQSTGGGMGRALSGWKNLTSEGENTSAKTKQCEFMYTATCSGVLQKWSQRKPDAEKPNFDFVKSNRLTHNQSGITDMQITANRKCLLTLDQNGSLLQWEIASDTPIHNWTKLNNGIAIKKFALGKESTYMFSADSQNRLKQWSIVKNRLHHDFG